MEILRPQIVRIGNRCYRKNPVLQREGNTAEEEEFTDFIPDSSGWNDETCTLDTPDIEQTSDGFQTAIQAPNGLLKFVIGKKGETKNRLEVETRTKIRIPKQGQKGDIVIQGHDRNGVMSAKTRIDVLLDSGRQKTPFTHFLSIPFNAKHFQDSLTDFKNDVLRECDGDRGVDGSIFQTPCKLHLTIGCLVLLDETDIRKAVDTLLECREDLIEPILRGEPLHVQLHGLEYMNDDPSEVDVLYAKVKDTSDRLQILADRLVDKFTSTGLMQREYDKVKLHITVMNTLFRKDPTGTDEPVRKQDRGRRERESFNAINLLKKFGDYRFGEDTVNIVHLSQRHSFGKDGYYTCAGTLNFS
ncbi:activating signal cointegrator 1 complex subunit 1-like [Ruditapes philippinarum]|uniref:activating signal cointegrator 1 complex subunit 1-like n=1 Tax=Ruditapes philippinarum TaxID=129788 RepID=UPI00295C254F|nr:activating signal cointegrator 1 complex subunit 1-like [Ruditapes philippinarum]XP_060565840.1 activating signal cointegrator 1 complex subunit 1-like [Ruditapes philippinarum]XP_060565841.1 activating signal cointegrator 1 complex subunit 1-like [Ruditapes philippinarum]XP_060565842.1 activating signal cointegrator 1 complex subunit 1-like [Ruditapes philippinarum]XP_060565843.1 activating signal cointegrator 1 complex subunit 1-like [Ruditapes philippinarum]XP_060565844.1 activating sign